MPQESVKLLSFLEENKMTNEEFRIIHHFPNETIKSHKKYCQDAVSRGSEFDPVKPNNIYVQQRMRIIYKALTECGFSLPPKKRVMYFLAKAALEEIPKL